MADKNHPTNYFGLNSKKRAYGYQGVPLSPNQNKQPRPKKQAAEPKESRRVKEPIQKNYPVQALEMCIHNRGRTGNKVGTGCRQVEEYACELFGHCILNACSYSGTRKICAKCTEFKHVKSEAAKEYLEMLNELGKAEPEQQEVNLEDLSNIDEQETQPEVNDEQKTQ